jgi:hypothetical protein
MVSIDDYPQLPDNGGLKGQKLSAQGIALGYW